MQTPHPMIVAAPVHNPHSTVQALLVDDSEFDRVRICRISEQLDRPVNIVPVGNLEGMQNQLRQRAFDLVLIDFSLGPVTGLAALDFLRELPDAAEIAKVMITNNSQAEIAISCFKHGCDDYILKEQLNPQVLDAVVNEAAARKQSRYHSSRRYPQTQDTVSDVLKDGLRQAAKAIGMETMIRDHNAVSEFVATFAAEDEFLFRPRDM